MAEALAVARTIQNERGRAYTLSELAKRLSGEQQVKVLVEATEAARAIQDKDDRVRALSNLTKQLPVHLLNEALIAMRATRTSRFRGNRH